MISNPIGWGRMMPYAVTLFLFSLFDFYLVAVGIRPLDILGFFIIVISISWASRQQDLQLQDARFVPLFSLLGLSFILVIGGCLNDPAANIKIGIGFLLGSIILICFYLPLLHASQTIRAIDILLGANTVCLLIQWVYFYSFGSILNFYWFLGLQPRAMSSIFRPTGLFLEPASYAVSMLMLLLLRTRIKGSLDWMSYTAIGSILLTISLWGFIACLIFLIYFKWKDWKFWSVIAVVVGIAYFYLRDSNAIQEFQLYRRLAGLDSDTSREVRLGGLVSIFEQPWSFLFGKGVTNDYLTLGSNGLGFLINAGGLLGTGIFIFLLYVLAPRRQKKQSIFFLMMILSAAPLWPYFYWWAWLGLYLRNYTLDGKEIKVKPTFKAAIEG